MDLSSQLGLVDFNSGKNADRLNFLDSRFSNLPLDYLNGVLPTAQFGSESVVPLGKSGKDLETSDDYKKWISDSNPIPDSSPVVVSQYNNAIVANLVWTNGATGGTLEHSHSIPSYDQPMKKEMIIPIRLKVFLF